MRYTSDIKILVGYVLCWLMLRFIQQQSIRVLKNVARDDRTRPQWMDQRSLYRVYRFTPPYFERRQQRSNAGCNSLKILLMGQTGKWNGCVNGD